MAAPSPRRPDPARGWIYRSITAAVPVWQNASINPGTPACLRSRDDVLTPIRPPLRD